MLFVRTGKDMTTGLVAQSLQTGRSRVILSNVRFARVLATGHLLYARDNTLAVQPINLSTLELTGGPTVVAESLTVSGSFPYTANVAIARNGSLAYVTAPAQLRLPVWLDRKDGRDTPLGAPAKPYVYPTISPDGTRVAFSVREGKYSNWIWNLADQTLSRITSETRIRDTGYGPPTASG